MAWSSACTDSLGKRLRRPDDGVRIKEMSAYRLNIADERRKLVSPKAFNVVKDLAREHNVNSGHNVMAFHLAFQRNPKIVRGMLTETALSQPVT